MNFIGCDVEGCTNSAEHAPHMMNGLPAGWRIITATVERRRDFDEKDKAMMAALPALAPIAETFLRQPPILVSESFHVCPVHELPKSKRAHAEVADAEFVDPQAAPSWVAEVLREAAATAEREK